MSKQKRRLITFRRLFVVLTVAFFFIVTGFGVVRLKDQRRRSQLDKSLSVIKRDVPYCNGEKLDLFVARTTQQLPLLIYIHGGGWQYGSKTGDTFEFVKPMVDQGFAVASINYRLSGAESFPAQIQDVLCAVRYLRSQASSYSIDGSKIGLIGISAGAHLAVLAANASDNQEFFKGPYQEQSSRVQAVVGISGIYDFASDQLNTETETNINKLLKGGTYNKTNASPKTYVSKDDPAQLILYGTKDKSVHTSQSLDYFKTAQEAGINAEILAVENANHVLQPNLYFLRSTEPSQHELFEKITDFFRNELN